MAGTQIDISLDNIDLDFDSVVKRIELLKAETASDIQQQFESVSGNTASAQSSAAGVNAGVAGLNESTRKKAEQAAADPSSLADVAGPIAKGATKGLSLSPSRITARGKGRGGRL